MSIPAQTQDGREIEIYDTECTCPDMTRARVKFWTPVMVSLGDGRRIEVCGTCHSMKRGDL